MPTAEQVRFIRAKYAAIKKTETAKRDRLRKELEAERKAEIKAAMDKHYHEGHLIDEAYGQAMVDIREQELGEMRGAER